MLGEDVNKSLELNFWLILYGSVFFFCLQTLEFYLKPNIIILTEVRKLVNSCFARYDFGRIVIIVIFENLYFTRYSNAVKDVSVVSKAAERSKMQRHDNFCDPTALMR